MGSSRGHGDIPHPGIRHSAAPGECCREEIGVNVKTLNRTIRQLKGGGVFSICKGKITFTRGAVWKAIEWLEAERINRKRIHKNRIFPPYNPRKSTNVSLTLSDIMAIF